MEKTFRIIIISISILIIGSLAASSYVYVRNIDPHTRYNPLRENCYYYYGYGSCAVPKVQCDGVPIGANKWINLGDACLRNSPPIIANNIDANQTQIIAYAKQTNATVIGKIPDITVAEGEKVIIEASCIDEDPVEISYSGWTTTQTTQTNYDDAGKYDEKITCTDSFNASTSTNITITILNQNRAPLFKAIHYINIPPKA